MSPLAASAPVTLMDALVASFDLSTRVPDGVVSPVALLWTDPDGQWRPLLPAVRKVVPHLYVLGDYAPSEGTGPVIWLKCVIDRALPDVAPPPDVIPILYLPQIARQSLRAGGDCPPALQPLIELQYRGAIWHQRNGRDWTVEAFLMSEQGLGLDVAQDRQTRDAALRALSALATEPVAGLRGRRVEAEDFDRLLIGDPLRDLLAWMNDVEAFQARCDANRWSTFRGVCAREFGFDPEADGAVTAGELLLEGEGRWDDVWRRFFEAPAAFPGVRQCLKEARPKDLLSDPSRRPGLNEEREDLLRRELEAVLDLPHGVACKKVLALESQHRERRGWVWAQVGDSPYAVALEPLGRLAQLAQAPMTASSLKAIIDMYAGGGWRCDRAALEALTTGKSGSVSSSVARVVKALYEPWLDSSARSFQKLMSDAGPAAATLAAGVAAEKDVCILFADGLRYDVATMLQEMLESRGLRVRLDSRLAPVPTVTATAKPLASPAHNACARSQDAQSFEPILAASGQPATTIRLRKSMEDMGVEVLDPEDLRMPSGVEHGGWLEAGSFDALGHALKGQMAGQIDRQVELLADRISELLNSGWERVRVVTDHGWLLLPGGLPKIDLPHYLVEARWARCAAVKGESATEIPTYPWHWNSFLRVASPPGVGSFYAGEEYAHGGISAQECVVPELLVARGEQQARASIKAVSWRGLRCRVSVETNAAGVTVDLRLNWKQAASSIAAGTKTLETSGEASLVVEDDRHEGAAAAVVVLDGSGKVLDYKATTVGEES